MLFCYWLLVVLNYGKKNTTILLSWLRVGLVSCGIWSDGFVWLHHRLYENNNFSYNLWLHRIKYRLICDNVFERGNIFVCVFSPLMISHNF